MLYLNYPYCREGYALLTLNDVFSGASKEYNNQNVSPDQKELALML